MHWRNVSLEISTGLAAAFVVWLGMLAADAEAGTFGWGDIDGKDVTFVDLTEDNDEFTSLYAPLPGTGSPFVDSNSLLLSPSQLGFSSLSSDGSADVIDSTLSTIIRAKSCSSLESINIFEHGDFSLSGSNRGSANVVVAGAFFWTILEVDFVPVSFASQATNLLLSTGAGPNGGQYSRPGDDGTGVNWNGQANIDLAGFLDFFGISGKATEVRLTFDNTLLTSAEENSEASVKTEFIDINVEVGVHISRSGIPTDCDDDFDVDGADFLLLQRRIPELIPMWQSFYGTGGSVLSSARTAVPEPGTALLLLLAALFYRNRSTPTHLLTR